MVNGHCAPKVWMIVALTSKQARVAVPYHKPTNYTALTSKTFLLHFSMNPFAEILAFSCSPVILGFKISCPWGRILLAYKYDALA